MMIQLRALQESMVVFRIIHWRNPSHFHVMSYTLEPAATENDVRISDSVQGDSPRQKGNGRRNGAVGVGIIFGQKRTDSSGADDKTHIAVSSLHFEPVDSVVWNISFREKQIQELTVELM